VGRQARTVGYQGEQKGQEEDCKEDFIAGQEKGKIFVAQEKHEESKIGFCQLCSRSSLARYSAGSNLTSLSLNAGNLFFG
jgi:hypothetical protein